MADKEAAPSTQPMSQSANPDERLGRILLIVAVALATTLRLFDLDRSGLVNDELSSWTRANLVGLGEVLSVARGDVHPPLYQLLLWGWIELFGDSETALRLPSAIASSGAVLAIGVLGRRLFGPTEGAIAALFAATAPGLVLYGRFARSYGLVHLLTVLLAILVVGCAARVASGARPRAGNLLLMGLLAGLALYTHYLSTLLVAFFGTALLVVAVTRNRPALPWILGIGLGVALLFAPWLPMFMEDLRVGGLKFAKAPGLSDLMKLGRLGHSHWLLAGGVALALLIREFSSSKSHTPKEPRPAAVSFVLLWLFGLGAVMWLYSLRSSIWTGRNLSLLSPAVALLYARVLVQLAGAHRPAALIAVALTLLTCGVGASSGTLLGSMPAGDFRSAAMVLAEQSEENRAAAVVTLSNHPKYFRYYFRSLDNPIEEDRWARSSKAAEAAVRELSRDHRLVWLLSGHKKFSKKRLKQLRKRFRVVEDHKFHGSRALLLELK